MKRGAWMGLWVTVAACAATSQASAPPPLRPAPKALPPAAAPPDAAVAQVAEPAPAPPRMVAARPCANRKLSFTVTRATGMGSYITTLICSGELFTVTSDRATPDGRERQQAFSIAHAEWEKAFRAVDDLGWRTLDDRCTEAQRRMGRGEGPVYRVTIDDGGHDKRTFICAGLREISARLDAVQSHLLGLAPLDLAAAPPAGVGVSECDEYLARYEQCVNVKVPSGKRQGFLDAIRYTREALRDALMRNPDGGVALASQCKEMHAAARSAMATFKCKM